MTKTRTVTGASRALGRSGRSLVALALLTGTGSVVMIASSSAVSGASSSGVAAATAFINQYNGIPKFVAPGPKLNPARLKGKTIYTIFSSTGIPFCNDVGTTITQAGAAYGIKNVVWPNQGQLSQWVQGFNRAIAAKASLINVGCGIDAAAVAPQIAAAKKAGIPVVTAHSYDPMQKVPASLSAAQYAPYNLAGQLEAAWTVKATNGKANVLVIDDVADDVSSPALVAGVKSAFAKYCPSCKVTYKDVPIPSWGTQIGSVVSAALSSNPSLNYIIPIYDGMVGFVLPALTSHNAKNVKISTFNGTPSVLDQMRTGNVITFDSAENFSWIGRGILDQDMRVLLKMAPAANEVTPMQNWTKANVAQAGVPATYSKGWGTVAQTGFARLW
jgi:ribose transport system substrate-binding protein